MELTRNEIVTYETWTGPACCHLRVYEEPGRDAVVVVGSLEDNPAASVTNTIEALAAQVAENCFAGRRRFELVEYRPAARYEPAFWDVRFEDAAANSFARALWDPLGRAELERRVGQRVTVYPSGHYTVANVERVEAAPDPQRAADALVPVCPEHGGDPLRGIWCAAEDPACYARLARDRRRYQPPRPPTRQGQKGVYVGTWNVAGPNLVEVRLRDRAPRPLALPPGEVELSWGYGGHGPGVFARALLGDWFGHPAPPQLAARFERDVAAQLPRQDFELPFRAVDEWVQGHHRRDRGLVFVAASLALEAFNYPLTWELVEPLERRGVDAYTADRLESTARRWDALDGKVRAHAGALERASALIVPLGAQPAGVHTAESWLAYQYAAYQAHDVAVVAVRLEEDPAPGGMIHAYEQLGAHVVECSRDPLEPVVAKIIELAERPWTEYG